MARSRDDIIKSMSITLSGCESNLVGYWPLVHPKFPLVDLSPFQNHGRLEGLHRDLFSKAEEKDLAVNVINRVKHDQQRIEEKINGLFHSVVLLEYNNNDSSESEAIQLYLSGNIKFVENNLTLSGSGSSVWLSHKVPFTKGFTHSLQLSEKHSSRHSLSIVFSANYWWNMSSMTTIDSGAGGVFRNTLVITIKDEDHGGHHSTVSVRVYNQHAMEILLLRVVTRKLKSLLEVSYRDAYFTVIFDGSSVCGLNLWLPDHIVAERDSGYVGIIAHGHGHGHGHNHNQGVISISEWSMSSMVSEESLSVSSQVLDQVSLVVYLSKQLLILESFLKMSEMWKVQRDVWVDAVSRVKTSDGLRDMIRILYEWTLADWYPEKNQIFQKFNNCETAYDICILLLDFEDILSQREMPSRELSPYWMTKQHTWRTSVGFIKDHTRRLILSNSLVKCGYSLERSLLALEHCQDDLNHAANWLIEHPGPDGLSLSQSQNNHSNNTTTTSTIPSISGPWVTTRGLLTFHEESLVEGYLMEGKLGQSGQMSAVGYKSHRDQKWKLHGCWIDQNDKKSPSIRNPININFDKNCETFSGECSGSVALAGSLNGKKVMDHEFRVLTGKSGLVNIGNTCYQNSFLQCLFMTDTLREKILSIRHIISKKDEFLAVFQKLFAYLQYTLQPHINPAFFAKLLPEHFRSGSQHDSFEFGKYVLEQLESSLKNTSSPNAVNEIFSGKWKNIRQCNECNFSSQHIEPFSDICLSFPSNYLPISHIAVVVEKLEPMFYAFKQIKTNLNEGRLGSSKAFLCYQISQANSYEMPITDICIVTAENNDNAFPPPGFSLLSTNLNLQGANQAYIGYKRNPNSSPITGLDVIASVDFDVPPPKGFIKIPTDINRGSSDYHVFVCYKKDYPVRDIKMIRTFKGDRSFIPDGYILIETDLNVHGVFGDPDLHVYICYTSCGSQPPITSLTVMRRDNPQFTEYKECGELVNGYYLVYKSGSGCPIQSMQVFKAPHTPENSNADDMEIIDILPHHHHHHDANKTEGIEGRWKMTNEETVEFKVSSPQMVLKRMELKVSDLTVECIVAQQSDNYYHGEGMWKESGGDQMQPAVVEIRGKEMMIKKWRGSKYSEFMASQISSSPSPSSLSSPKFKPAITDVCIVYEGREPIPDGYEVIKRTVGGNQANLNFTENGYDNVYLCVQRGGGGGGGGAPIVDMAVIYSGLEPVPDGFIKLEYTPSGLPCTFHPMNGCICICIKRGTADDQMVLTDVDIIQRDKEGPPPGMEVIQNTHSACLEADLNAGSSSREIYLCIAKEKRSPPSPVPVPPSPSPSSPSPSPSSNIQAHPLAGRWRSSLGNVEVVVHNEDLQGMKVEGWIGQTKMKMDGFAYTEGNNKNTWYIAGMCRERSSASSSDLISVSSPSPSPAPSPSSSSSSPQGVVSRCFWEITSSFSKISGSFYISDKLRTCTGFKDNYLLLALSKDYKTYYNNHNEEVFTARASGDNVESMVKEFFCPEILSGRNSFSCQSCAKISRETKQNLYIIRPPNHLMLNIKRFKYDRLTRDAKKILRDVDFNVLIEVPYVIEKDKDPSQKPLDNNNNTNNNTNTIKRKALYGLYGIIVHSGWEIVRGHYFAFCRHSEGTDLSKEDDDASPWMRFDDPEVTISSFSRIKSLLREDVAATAYVLFYKRIDHDQILHRDRLSSQLLDAPPSPLIVKKEDSSQTNEEKNTTMTDSDLINPTSDSTSTLPLTSSSSSTNSEPNNQNKDKDKENENEKEKEKENEKEEEEEKEKEKENMPMSISMSPPHSDQLHSPTSKQSDKKDGASVPTQAEGEAEEKIDLSENFTSVNHENWSFLSREEKLTSKFYLINLNQTTKEVWDLHSLSFKSPTTSVLFDSLPDNICRDCGFPTPSSTPSSHSPHCCK